MSCSINTNKVIEWTIENKHITDLYKHLYDTIEHGGKFKLNTMTKNTASSESRPGQKDSADAPDAILNWHSHPISCYKQEKTVWGWPSGEDMRESMIYGLRGSACHVVPAVEGTYTIQPNPCVVTSLIGIDKIVNKEDYPDIERLVGTANWGNFLRGFIILAIEIYFRSTHVFRTIDYMHSYPGITADDFIQFTNVFQLKNIFSKSKISGCSKISCNQILKFENKKASQIPFEKYVKSYEADTEIYFIGETGNHTGSNIKFLKVLESGGLELLEQLVLGTNCKIPVPKWHTGRVFLIRLHHNNVIMPSIGFDGDYHSLSDKDKVKFIMHSNHSEGDIYLPSNTIIKFFLFDMYGNCNHTNLQKHVQDYKNDNEEYVPIHHTVKKRRSNERKKRRSKSKGRKKKSFGKSIKKRKKKGRNTKKGKEKGKEKGSMTKITIIGSSMCSHCGVANEKAKKLKKIHRFGYTFEEFPTIREAVDRANSLSPGSNINSIPAYFVNGIYSETPPF